MPLTTAGAQLIAKAVTNLNSPTLFNSSTFSIGVGNGGGTAFSIGQTDLQGASKFRKLVSSLTELNGVVTAVASYATSEANFDWSEHGSFNTGNTQTGGTMLNRKVESPSLGVKDSSQTWQLTKTLTFSAS